MVLNSYMYTRLCIHLYRDFFECQNVIVNREVSKTTSSMNYPDGMQTLKPLACPTICVSVYSHVMSMNMDNHGI